MLVFFEDIRQAEIIEESSNELDSLFDTAENMSEFPLNTNPPYIILWEATRSYYEEKFDKKSRVPINSKELDCI